MRFLQRERATLEALLPGLDTALAELSTADLESPGSPGLAAFRQCGGPGLLVPAEYKGCGASALDAVQVQRAVGARSPSLAIATTMHHFSTAGLVVLSEQSSGLEWMLMEAVASAGKLVASGFAEGRTGAGVLDTTMTATRTDHGVLISGVKRPCSLARSMDLLTASVRLLDGSPGGRPAIAIIPLPSDGLTVTPFWGSPALAGAESDTVTLHEVFVPGELVVPVTPTDPGILDGLQLAGFVWFELLMTASYLGVASGLVERVLARDRGTSTDRVRLAGDLDAAMAAVENLARQVGDRRGDADLLGEVLLVRYAVQDCLARVTPAAVELLGGLAFLRSPEVLQFAGATHGLGFHPPSRASTADALAGFLAGGPLLVA
jgi:alkylation response protein AidB-like acyl-CoA dehydrogenase